MFNNVQKLIQFGMNLYKLKMVIYSIVCFNSVINVVSVSNALMREKHHFWIHVLVLCAMQN